MVGGHFLLLKVFCFKWSKQSPVIKVGYFRYQFTVDFKGIVHSAEAFHIVLNSAIFLHISLAICPVCALKKLLALQMWKNNVDWVISANLHKECSMLEGQKKVFEMVTKTCVNIGVALQVDRCPTPEFFEHAHIGRTARALLDKRVICFLQTFS